MSTTNVNKYNIFGSLDLMSNDYFSQENQAMSSFPLTKSVNLTNDKNRYLLTQSYFPKSNINYNSFISPDKNKYQPEPHFINEANLMSPLPSRPKTIFTNKFFGQNPDDNPQKYLLFNSVNILNQKQYDRIKLDREPKDNIKMKRNTIFKNINQDIKYYNNKKPKDKTRNSYIPLSFKALDKLPTDQNKNTYSFKKNNNYNKKHDINYIHIPSNRFGPIDNNKNTSKKEQKKSINNYKGKNNIYSSQKLIHKYGPLDNPRSQLKKNANTGNKTKNIKKDPIDNNKDYFSNDINENVHEIKINEPKEIKSKDSLNNINVNLDNMNKDELLKYNDESKIIKDIIDDNIYDQINKSKVKSSKYNLNNDVLNRNNNSENKLNQELINISPIQNKFKSDSKFKSDYFDEGVSDKNINVN